MRLKFLGQTGFLISGHGKNFLIDPYLSNYVVTSGIGDARYFSRQFPPPVTTKELINIHAIFITHDHADHCDPQTILPILKDHPACRVVAPGPALDLLLDKGMDSSRVLLPSLQDWQEFDQLRFIALPSAHYALERNEVTGAFPFLGYVFDLEGIKLYHAGDTILYDGMVERLLEISSEYDVCCLPANGRDPAREDLGIIGNLQPHEALWLAEKIHAGLLIPTHNDMFLVNQIDPSILMLVRQTQFPELDVKWLEAGEEIILTKKSAP